MIRSSTCKDQSSKVSLSQSFQPNVLKKTSKGEIIPKDGKNITLMALQAMTFSSFEMKTFTLDAAFNGPCYETNASIRNHSDLLEYIIYFEVTFVSNDQNFLTFLSTSFSWSIFSLSNYFYNRTALLTATSILIRPPLYYTDSSLDPREIAQN